MKNELDEKLKQIRKEGRRYRENIPHHFMDLLRDISCGSNSVHSHALGCHQACTATGESRGTGRNGAEGRGKEKGKTDGRGAVDL